MVEQSFAAVKDPASARILDASCGAGIFLVLSFRRLVRERWQHDEERPRTRAIQDILYHQLCGFDVSESALRLAALALYITAIEVNATQRPPKDLKFPESLRNKALFRLGEDGAPTESEAANAAVFVLGSLGPKSPPKFVSSFDIVIGNPPWTRLRENEPEGAEEKAAARTAKKAAKTETDVLNEEFTRIGRRVLEARGLASLAKEYENPDKNPDLPFLWRAAEWAKPGGIIALAMPARIFGRTTGKGFQAWRAVLRAVALTGLVSGADLRWSVVWKGVKMPFCLLFARNSPPARDQCFFYAAPVNEPELNATGRFRIDYETTQPIGTARLEKQPWLLKTLSLGTWLDVELMETLSNGRFKTLAEFWTDWDKKAERTGKGYDRSPGLLQHNEEFLGDMKDFRPSGDNSSVDWNSLNTYEQNHETKTAALPRNALIYQPPLVIIPQSPGETTTTPKAYIFAEPLAFSQSYYGYSCAGHPEAETLAALLYLLPHSALFAYFCLMTSRRRGFDRQTFNKEEFDAMPFPDLAKLPATDKESARTLAGRLAHDHAKPWDEIDSLLFRLYGLDNNAVQIVEDTLFGAASYRRAGRSAFERTKRENRAPFLSALAESLEPYFDVCGEHVAVAEPRFQPDTWEQPWFFLAVSREGQTAPVNPNLLCRAMEAANERAASRIIVRVPNRRGLLVGLLNEQTLVDGHPRPSVRSARRTEAPRGIRPPGKRMTQKETSGLFTRGLPPERYRLPHPRLGLPVILLIHRVLLRAFELLRQQRFALPAAEEDQVTAALRSIIENDLRQTGEVAGFNKASYEKVIRQGQVANYDNTRLNKAPDLCFSLRDNETAPRPVLSEHDGLFVECKPVDASHAAGGRYCDDGLCRFVNGDYAWAMEEAMMLAYARDGRTIAKHLLPAMSEPVRMKSLQTEQLPRPSTATGASSTNLRSPFTSVVIVAISHGRMGKGTRRRSASFTSGVSADRIPSKLESRNLESILVRN